MQPVLRSASPAASKAGNQLASSHQQQREGLLAWLGLTRDTFSSLKEYQASSWLPPACGTRHIAV